MAGLTPGHLLFGERALRNSANSVVVAMKKSNFPVSDIRHYLEPGPIVLVSSRWRDKTNIMTMGWYTVMEFSPALVGCVIASANYSFDLVRKSGECVINLPTTRLTDKVVGIGNCSGAEI